MFITTCQPLYAPAFLRWLGCRKYPFISLTGVECCSSTSHVKWMTVISYLLLIPPLKVLHCLHWVLNSHFCGYVTGSNQRFYPLCHVSLKTIVLVDNSPKNVNNSHNTSSLKYRQILNIFMFEISELLSEWLIVFFYGVSLLVSFNFKLYFKQFSLV